MKRSIKYKDIKKIVYTMNMFELNAAARLYLSTETDLFIETKKPCAFTYEWCDDEKNKTYLEITQTIVEKETVEK